MQGVLNNRFVPLSLKGKQESMDACTAHVFSANEALCAPSFKGYWQNLLRHFQIYVLFCVLDNNFVKYLLQVCHARHVS